jgi:hypothetical protein
MLHPWLLFCQIGPLKGWFSLLKFCKWMINFKKFKKRLPNSASRGVDDSPTHKCGAFSFKHLIADSPSQRLPDSAFFSDEILINRLQKARIYILHSRACNCSLLLYLEAGGNWKHRLWKVWSAREAVVAQPCSHLGQPSFPAAPDWR